MYRVIETEEGHERIFILLLHFLRRLLKAGKHGSFAARKMLARITVLADFGKELLHNDKLIGNKGKLVANSSGPPNPLMSKMESVKRKGFSEQNRFHHKQLQGEFWHQFLVEPHVFE
jgi:hypothetical protein